MFIENRQFLPPGYTGHIPYRNDVVGLTHAEATKTQLQQYEMFSGTPQGKMISLNRNFHLKNGGNSLTRDTNNQSSSQADSPQYAYNNQKMMQIGNQSRNAASWVGGPKYEIRQQQIPGYQGFLPGINAENLYGKSYTKCSASSMNNKIERGFNITPEKRYMTQNQKAFAPKNFRRLKERPELANQRDYLEYTMTLNHQDNRSRTKLLDISADNVNLDQYHLTQKSRNSNYFDPSGVTMSPPKSINPRNNNFFMQKADIQVRPILIEKNLADKDEFKKLGDGFKRIFSEDSNDQGSLVLPVAGYTGHRKGSVAENMFGKSYRDATIQSKKLERIASLNKSAFVKPY
ncbi:UNKNOWN [Stylonychia lemnae]|uniref:Uncharacterized protein n=1 Tax=Stylonychia lemnae TaxID=5949 RepID=A0A078AIF7_STYLE|nr:UNKNOWN [Stylonychia lemnae]|eukprot:CDW82030.1 UNKNOWN [Stylonychia lemnae]